MPGWGGDNRAELLYENRTGLLFAGETVSAGTVSMAYQLRRMPGLAYPWGVSFELCFGSDPGAFEVDIEAADSDLDGSYLPVGSISSSGSNMTAIGNLWARFVRARVLSLANAVPMTLMVTR